MNKRIPILIGIILVVLAILLQIIHIDFLQFYFTRLENLAYDVQLRTKLLIHPKKLDTFVVVVDVDDKSIAKEGRWPWPRSKIAKLVTRLQEEGAVVVTLDMFFPTSEENIVDQVDNALNQNMLLTPQIEPALKKIAPLFDNDALLGRSLAKKDSVIGMIFTEDPLATGQLPPPVLTLKTPAEKNLNFIREEGYLANIPILQNAAKNSGFVNVYNDEDGIIRRVPLLVRYQDNLYPSLALETVRLFLLGNIELITAKYADKMNLEGVRLVNHIIPTDDRAQMIVPFRGKSYTFPYFSATDVLNKHIPENSLQGKIAIVGTSAAGLGDIKATAIESTYPGEEIQATIADSILTDNYFYRPPWALGAEIFITALLGLIFAFIFPYMGPRLLALIIIFVPIILVFLNNFLWSQTGLIISILIPILLTLALAFMNIVYGYLFESRRREHLKEMFGQYVPAKHIDEMLAAKGGYALHGEDRVMTVLFADIRNFTMISEHMSAAQIKEMLNEFFTPMTEIIFKYKGTIDKYVGDLIMAFWGAPLKDKNHASHALSAALEMQETVRRLEPELTAKGWPSIHIGVGLNTGEMSVGDMGSKFRRNYTVLGDAVNLASRIESLTKYYGVEIIATENTIKDQENKFIFQFLDKVRVKGKKEPVAIFELICLKSKLTPEIAETLGMTRMALDFYFSRDWQKSKELFLKLNAISPQTKLYEMYLKRIQVFEEFPPAEDWGGVFTLHEK